jgi:hypothetical protein
MFYFFFLYLICLLFHYLNCYVKDGSSVLQHFGGSVVKAVMHVFPNVGLDESKFGKVRRTFLSFPLFFLFLFFFSFPLFKIIYVTFFRFLFLSFFSFFFSFFPFFLSPTSQKIIGIPPTNGNFSTISQKTKISIRSLLKIGILSPNMKFSCIR